jgi:porin
MDIDLDPLAGLSGTSFHISWHAYHGGQPSEDLVGQFPTDALSGDEAEDSIRFYNLYLQQQLFDARLVVQAGYMVVEQEFFAAGHAAALQNASFGDFGSGRGQEVAPFYPVTAPALVVTARPTEVWVARAGVYAADPGEDESGNIGFDGSFGDGVTFYTELGTDRRPFGRPGSYTLGSAATTSSVRNFDQGGQAKGAYGIYALVDQTLAVDAEGDTRLAAFLRGQFNFKQERTVIRGAFTAGLVAYGLVPGRERDALALGYSYTRFGRDYRSSVRASGENATRQESLVELTYRAQLTGWLTLQPDLQLIFDPHSNGSNAIAAGLTAVIEL